MKLYQKLFFAVLFLLGSLMVLSPYIYQFTHQAEVNQAIEEFEEERQPEETTAEEVPTQETAVTETAAQETKAPETVFSETVNPSVVYPELLQAMQEYNEKIYAEGQSGLCDAWSYEQADFDLSAYGISDGVIGTVSIPSIDSTLPIYLGASTENMRKGAVQLGQTSMPIGGINTNCVLAAHRGYRGIPFWRNVEGISVGDTVTLTNLWETLTYQVTKIEIIEPTDIEKVLIQPGKDMLTLITCHPYGGHGIYRYVVYCKRVESSETTVTTETTETTKIESTPTETMPGETETIQEDSTPAVSAGMTFVSSQPRINLDGHLQTAGLVLLGTLLCGFLVSAIIKRRKKK